jgi:exodeoxyribonuclease V alpha subunit
MDHYMVLTNSEEVLFLKKLHEFDILQEGQEHEELKGIYLGSQRLELPFLDYITIRDLMELSGYQFDAPLAALLVAMFSVLQEGSLCLDLAQGGLFARLLAFMEKKKAEEIQGRLLSNLENGAYERLIARNGHGYLPLVLEESNSRRLLYFQRFYVHERRLKDRIEALLEAKCCHHMSDEEAEKIISDVYADELTIRKGGKPITEDPFQIEAMRLALHSQFCIISGGPGTGKTSLMVNMIRCLVRAGVPARQILLGAPTGRAAQRMTEALQHNISTIHRPSSEDKELLGLKGSTLHKILRYTKYRHAFHYNHANPLPASVIFIDEASMVDVIMMEKFLQAADPAVTKIIFLGDKDQLPSVEAGTVFAEMIPEGTRAERFRGRLIILGNVYRAGRNLLQMAERINQGECPEYKTVSFGSALKLKPDSWAFVQDEGLSAWKRCIQQWVNTYYLSHGNGHGKSFRDLVFGAAEMDPDRLLSPESGQESLDRIFGMMERSRILSVVRKGAYGCEGINSRIAQILCREFESSAWNEKSAFTGAVIMITQNDYTKELFNGDTGVVIRDERGTCRAYFRRFGSYISFAMDSLPPWDLAFAITVHKSQGSEFEDALLVLPEDEDHRLLSREIVYTGITRAKKRVILYGHESGLMNALKKKIKRQSGLSW